MIDLHICCYIWSQENTLRSNPLSPSPLPNSCTTASYCWAQPWHGTRVSYTGQLGRARTGSSGQADEQISHVLNGQYGIAFLAWKNSANTIAEESTQSHIHNHGIPFNNAADQKLTAKEVRWAVTLGISLSCCTPSCPDGAGLTQGWSGLGRI